MALKSAEWWGLHPFHRSRRLFAKPGQECFNQVIETGVLHGVGLRDTLEPDPGNTGVGSFRSQTAFFLEIQREFSCFSEYETRGEHARIRSRSHGPHTITIFRSSRLCVENIGDGLLPVFFSQSIHAEPGTGRHGSDAGLRTVVRRVEHI